jgi:hypothetical protein
MTVVQRRIPSLSVLALVAPLAMLCGCGGKSDRGEGAAPVSVDVAGGSSGRAGANSGASTSGGSATGGSASGGDSSLGGSSTSGGSASAGGTAGFGSTGVGAFDEPPEGACLEKLSPYDRTSPQDLDVHWSAAPNLLALDRHAPLAWADGTRSDVTLTFVGVSAWYVESTRNPGFAPDIVANCENHVRLVSTGRLTSADGRLDETLPEMSLNVGETTLYGVGSYVGVHGVTTLEPDRLRGFYAPAISDDQCFAALRFEVSLVQGVFEGSILEEIAPAPCDLQNSDGGVVERVAGTWQCVDDGCSSYPTSTAVVVEAESCDGIGVQLTSPGDESSFALVGDALVRREEYGCGCASFADFVLAWAPHSPLELRLCRNDSLNDCAALCAGEQSYDLTTAFRTSGTSQFRFVD